MGKQRRFTIKKYDGDDSHSYAVFYSEDVKGMGFIIFYGQARPVVSGLTHSEAKYHRDQLKKGGNTQIR